MCNFARYVVAGAFPLHRKNLVEPAQTFQRLGWKEQAELNNSQYEWLLHYNEVIGVGAKPAKARSEQDEQL